MKKKIIGMLDAWSRSLLFHRPCEPAYNIVDCRISSDNKKHILKIIEIYKIFLHNQGLSKHGTDEKSSPHPYDIEANRSLGHNYSGL